MSLTQHKQKMQESLYKYIIDYTISDFVFISFLCIRLPQKDESQIKSSRSKYNCISFIF